MTQVNEDAINIYISGLKQNPSLEFMPETKNNGKRPFLKHDSLILSHKQAEKIINGLRTFYTMHSEKDIQLINSKLKNYNKQKD